jgi:membrane protease YdiL (CAAX protease family)
VINKDIITGKILLTVLLLFYLNDFLFIAYQSNYYALIGIDYGTRVLSLLLLGFFGVRYKDISLKSHNKGEVIKWTFFIFILSFLISTLIEPILSFQAPWFTLFKFPKYPELVIKSFDLIFGLMLVAISEEVIFRGMVITWLKKKMFSEKAIVYISCVVFGLMHWCSGFSTVVSASLFAILPGKYYLKERKLLPCILGHYFANFILFL